MNADDTTGTTEPARAQDELTVTIDGHEFTVEENVDFDGDGDNDTAVLQASDGAVIAIADTDHDGVADVVVEYDGDGNPVAGAEYDPATGIWRTERVDALPTPGGAGADDSTTRA
jgi:hypothetical protein